MMQNTDFTFSQDEQDILKEILNIGLAKAADSFAVIAHDRVMLNVPEVKIIGPEEVVAFLPDNDRTDVVVQSDVETDLRGKTFLIFNEKQAKHLAEICIGSPIGFKGNYAALKRSLMLEVSNILTGALITQLANILDLHLYATPPQIIPFALRQNFSNLLAEFELYQPMILTVKTEFLNSGRLVEMPLIIVFNTDAINKIFDIIKEKTHQNPRWLAQ